MHNLHPRENIHTGCKLAPGCILVMKTVYYENSTGKIASGCEFAPPFEVMQIQWSKLAPGAHLPRGANCVHERNLLSHM